MDISALRFDRFKDRYEERKGNSLENEFFLNS